MPDSVRAIRWPSHSSCGDTDRFQFIRCVDVRDTKVHEVWILGEDGVTPKVHPTAQVDVGAGIVGDFATHYLTENGRRVPMFVKKPIKGSFDFLGVPDPLRNNGPPWIDNILVPSPAWGVGGTVTNSNWGSQPGGRYGSVSVLWRGAVPFRPALDDGSDKSSFLCLQQFFFLSRLFFYDDEYDNDGYGSGSSGTCAFPF